MAPQAFGIDIGGSGIKGAIVDTSTGQLVTKRTRIVTPRPSTPDAVAEVVAKLVSDLGYAPIELGKIAEGGRLIQARNALIFQNLIKVG